MSWFDPTTWGIGGDIAGMAFLGFPLGHMDQSSLSFGGDHLVGEEEAAAADARGAEIRAGIAEDISRDPFSAAFEALRTRSYLESAGRRGYRDTYLIGPRGTEGEAWGVTPGPNWGAMELPNWIQFGGMTQRTGRPPRPPRGGEAPPPRTVDEAAGGTPGVDNNPSGATPQIEPLDMEPLDVWVGRSSPTRQRR